MTPENLKERNTGRRRKLTTAGLILGKASLAAAIASTACGGAEEQPKIEAPLTPTPIVRSTETPPPSLQTPIIQETPSPILHDTPTSIPEVSPTTQTTATPTPQMEASPTSTPEISELTDKKEAVFDYRDTWRYYITAWSETPSGEIPEWGTRHSIAKLGWKWVEVDFIVQNISNEFQKIPSLPGYELDFDGALYLITGRGNQYQVGALIPCNDCYKIGSSEEWPPSFAFNGFKLVTQIPEVDSEYELFLEGRFLLTNEEVKEKLASKGEVVDKENVSKELYENMKKVANPTTAVFEVPNYAKITLLGEFKNCPIKGRLESEQVRKGQCIDFNQENLSGYDIPVTYSEDGVLIVLPSLEVMKLWEIIDDSIERRGNVYLPPGFNIDRRFLIGYLSSEGVPTNIRVGEVDLNDAIIVYKVSHRRVLVNTWFVWNTEGME